MEDFKILEEKENLLFGRKEIVFQIVSGVTPSRVEIGKLVKEKFSAEPRKVKIRKISGKFGSRNFNISIFIYDSEKQKNRIEIKKKKDNLHIVEEKKAEERPVEEKKTGEIKEEKKTEIKDEEKKE